MSDQVTHPSVNPWPKRLGLALLALFLILIALAVSIVIWIQSSAGRNFVEARLEGMDIGGQTVVLDGLNGSVLGALSVDRITLSGRDGVWLVAQDVSFDWTPRSLLSKTLQVNEVTIGDLDVLQKPILVPSESGNDPLITTFDIRRFSLPDIALSEPVVGRAVNLSASGTLAHGPDGGEASLSARSDAGDTVDTDLAWSPLLVLSGEADIEGPAGGLIAGLLRLDPAQSITADVTTENEQTTVLAQIDGGAFADLTISRGQSSVSVAGTINPDPLPILESVAPLLGGEARLDAVLPLDEGAAASLDLQSPRVTLSASGARSGDLIELDQFNLTADEVLQSFELDGIGIGRLTASGRAVIGDRYTFDGQVIGESLAYNDYRVDRLAGPTSLSFEDSIISFDTAMMGTSSDTSLALASGAKLIAKGTLDIDRRAIAMSQADINLPGLSVRGNGSIGYGEQTSMAFNGRYSVNTAVFRDGPSAQLTGRATVTQTVRGPLAELTGQARSLGNLPDAVTTLVPNGFNYTARVRFEDGRVVVPRFTAGNDTFKANGSGRWQDGNLSSKIDYTASRYQYGAINAETVHGTALLSGPPSTLGFETDMTIDSLETGALVTTSATITANGTYSDGVATLTGTLAGDSEQGRIDAKGDIVASGSNWSVTDIEGDLGTLTATGSLSGIGGDLAALRGDMVVSGTSDLVPADAIEAKILLQDASVDIDATLSGVTAAQLQDATVRIMAKGPRQSVTYQIRVDGMTTIADLQRPLKLSADGVANLLAEALATDARFDLSVGSLALTGEAAADQSDAGWRTNVKANGLGGAIQADFDPADGGALSFAVDSLSVPQLARLLARPATEGSLSGEGRFFVVSDNIEGAAKISFDNLRSPISDAEAISVLASITLAEEQLSMTMGATEGGLSGQASINGAVDTYPRAPFMTFPPATPLQGKADLNGEIGPIVELFLPPQTDVAGRIDATLSFTLPNTPTGLQGRVALTDGKFEQGALGLELTDIAIVAELSGETISVPTLSARGVDGGTLSGSGRMGLGEGTGTVDIRTEKLRVVSRSEGQAEVSGELNVSRTVELLRLGGELRVTDADLNIARLPKPGLPTLDVDFGEVSQEDDTRSFASTATEIDIRIISDGRINVRGRGLNAAMNLDAAVRGPFDAPIVTGQMSIERGRFDFLSKRFEFRESSVTLLEDTLQSRLNLEAVRETSDLTAVVAITGTLERPEIKLTSEPNLPEDEVLSRILFGRSPTQLSAIETARLAAAISQMSGGSGFDLFGSLENAIGLDTLELGQNTTGQTQLTTGKYLSDDVYLEVRTAAEGTPGIAVEWAVRDNVSLEAETLPNEGQRLSVQWKKDFD